MWPSTTSRGSCECSREVASRRRLSFTRPPPVGSELVICSIRVSSWGRESPSEPLEERKMVAGLGAAANHKRSLGDTGEAARAVRGDDFENCFTGKWCGVWHGPLGAEL